MPATLLNEYGMVWYGTEGKWGGEVPDHLGQTDFTEICRPILVTKYISKLNKFLMLYQRLMQFR